MNACERCIQVCVCVCVRVRVCMRACVYTMSLGFFAVTPYALWLCVHSKKSQSEVEEETQLCPFCGVMLKDSALEASYLLRFCSTISPFLLHQSPAYSPIHSLFHTCNWFCSSVLCLQQQAANVRCIWLLCAKEPARHLPLQVFRRQESGAF